MKTKRALIGASLLACVITNVSACTWFEFQNDLKHTFIGRSMEWPGELQGVMAIVPRDHEIGAAKKFKTKHGFVGISHTGMFSDGLNEHGLACSALWLAESKYPEKTDNSLHVGDVVGYVLGNMKNVDEAVEFFKKTPLYSDKVAVMNDILPTFHYAITEPSGRSVVVEVIDGKVSIHENKVGAMTNDPAYDKQMEIWSKHKGKQLNEESFEAFDYSPEGRFCRMAAMNATQEKVPTDADAVNRAWSMLNTVDIPKGILYWRWVNDDPQFTSYAVVGDLHNRVYYFRTYNNYDIRKVDLAKIDFANVPFQSASIFGDANYQEFQFPAR